MQQVQDLLEFEIDKPSDKELIEKFYREAELMSQGISSISAKKEKSLTTKVFKSTKKRNRKSKHEKKLERLNR